MKRTDIIHSLSTGDLSASESETKEERTFTPLKLDLQFFADNDDDDDGDGEGDDDGDDDSDDDDDGDDDVPDFDELMKNPKFRKRQKEVFEDRLAKRLKKFKDVDPEEYRRLKAEADKGKGKGKDKDEDDDEPNREVIQKIAKAETKIKTAAVKEFAIDEGVDPVLLVKFIDMKKVELDEDGEPENLQDLFDDLLDSKHAKYFATADEDEDEDVSKKKKKTSGTYTPGTKQKINKSKKVDPKTLGAAKAAERHKKKEE